MQLRPDQNDQTAHISLTSKSKIGEMLTEYWAELKVKKKWAKGRQKVTIEISSVISFFFIISTGERQRACSKHTPLSLHQLWNACWTPLIWSSVITLMCTKWFNTCERVGNSHAVTQIWRMKAIAGVKLVAHILHACRLAKVQFHLQDRRIKPSNVMVAAAQRLFLFPIFL